MQKKPAVIGGFFYVFVFPRGWVSWVKLGKMGKSMGEMSWVVVGYIVG